MFKFMVTKLIWIVPKILIQDLALTYLFFISLINVLD